MYRSTDIDVQKNPMPFLEQLRHEAPVYRDPDSGAYLVTRDEDIRRVAMDTASFSNVIDPSIFRVVQGLSLEQSDPEVAERLKTRGWLLPTTLLLTDPPAHTRYRRLVQEALNPRAVEQLSSHLRERVRTLNRDFAAGTPVDFVEAFAKKLPIWVIGRFIFGAPESDFDQINDWADQFFTTLMPAAPREEYLKTVDAMIDMHHYIKAKIDDLRHEHKEDVLLSRLIRVHEQTQDEPLSDPELISMMHVMLLAGHDTTRQTLGNSVLELARRPELFARMREDRKLIPNFINEVLRMNAPANMTTRIALCDADVNGTTIPKGSMLFVAWGSAGRDESAHPDSNRFDVDRPDARSHLSFGWGLHHCVGAHLARAQIRISLEEILDEFGGVRLAVDESELDYVPSMNLRSLLSLPVCFDSVDATDIG
ncbi:MAG: cytochrome P450 [Pseudomonadota bacterium]|nr:cytochrome P450 [Pseudomonadota bacterium]